MAITVRPATVADEHFIATLGAATARATTPAAREVPVDVAVAAWDRLRRFCARQAGTVTLIAEDEGDSAGFAILLTDMLDDVSQQPQGFIAYMAVDASHRRRGVGTALLAAAERETAARGLPMLTLMVAFDNAAARALYEAYGLAPERLQLAKPLRAAPR